MGAADVRPFAQIRLPQNDRTRGAQPRDDRRIAARDVVLQRQRARGGGDRVGGLDIVLHQQRNAEQRPMCLAGFPGGIGRLRLAKRIRIDRDHAMKRRPVAIDCFNAPEIGAHDPGRSHPPGRHIGLQLRDRFFRDVITRRMRVCGTRRRKGHAQPRPALRPHPEQNVGCPSASAATKQPKFCRPISIGTSRDSIAAVFESHTKERSIAPVRQPAERWRGGGRL
jgi:hypothetical protein